MTKDEHQALRAGYTLFSIARADTHGVERVTVEGGINPNSSAIPTSGGLTGAWLLFTDKLEAVETCLPIVSDRYARMQANLRVMLEQRDELRAASRRNRRSTDRAGAGRERTAPCLRCGSPQNLTTEICVNCGATLSA